MLTNCHICKCHKHVFHQTQTTHHICMNYAQIYNTFCHSLHLAPAAMTPWPLRLIKFAGYVISTLNSRISVHILQKNVQNFCGYGVEYLEKFYIVQNIYRNSINFWTVFNRSSIDILIEFLQKTEWKFYRFFYRICTEILQGCLQNMVRKFDRFSIFSIEFIG